MRLITVKLYKKALSVGIEPRSPFTRYATETAD